MTGRSGGDGRERRCTFLFKEKESTKGKPFWRKTAFFEKGWGGGGEAWSRRIGHNEADPPMGCVKRAWRRVGVLSFDLLLSDGEKAKGVALLKPSPRRGRGTVEDGG